MILVQNLPKSLLSRGSPLVVYILLDGTVGLVPTDLSLNFLFRNDFRKFAERGPVVFVLRADLLRPDLAIVDLELRVRGVGPRSLYAARDHK